MLTVYLGTTLAAALFVTGCWLIGLAWLEWTQLRTADTAKTDFDRSIDHWRDILDARNRGAAE